VTGSIYQHNGGGGIPDRVAQGINETRLTGILAAQPQLTAPLTVIRGSDLLVDTQQNFDKHMLRTLERQNTALAHGPGYLVHVWELSSFAGSASTVSLRNPLPGDRVIPRPSRLPVAAPAPPPPPPPGAVPEAAPAPPQARGQRPTPVTPIPAGRQSSHASPTGRIAGRVVNNMYLIGTTFRRN
jgi:hypothetical protein